MLAPQRRFIGRRGRGSVPKLAIFYDTESEPEELPDGILHRFRLGYYQAYQLNPAYGQRAGDGLYRLIREGYFESPGEFFTVLGDLVATRRKATIFAHNQHFDFNLLGAWHILENMGYKFMRIVIDSDVFIVRAVKGPRKLTFLDTMNYFRTSVSRLGQLVGLPKIEVDFANASEEQLKERCKRDVEIIARAMTSLMQWWVDGKYGSWGPTLASLAYNAYRGRFMRFRIERSTIDSRVELEREALRGGRCEAFKIGIVKGPVHVLDVNSMYPYAMWKHEYPYMLSVVKKGMNVKELEDYMDYYSAIADVHFTVDEPMVCVKREKLVCPVGDVRAVLTTPELKLAMEYGKINKVYRAHFYRSAMLFREFVEHFYSLREKYKSGGNAVGETFSKLIMNSLYGKFAQRVQAMVPVELGWRAGPLAYTEYDGETRETARFYKLGSKWYKLVRGERYAEDVNLAIAAHITAFARTHLWRLMEAAGLDNVYYVDTDALFVSREGYMRLRGRVGSGLGQLKVSATCKELEIRGSKDYVCDISEKVKGVPREAVLLSSGHYAYRRFLKTKSLLLKGVGSGVLEVLEKKQLARAYDKGIVRPDGRVEPFQFNDPM